MQRLNEFLLDRLIDLDPEVQAEINEYRVGSLPALNAKWLRSFACPLGDLVDKSA
ncbi:hypothetical protein EBME_1638 [bacterium endosymbiont of Mortierella elongata FMR23-6]|nr:hypothetical protein EBME_1638 [bacterium endosymbiont of Mortierella elongata FMR23-6]